MTRNGRGQASRQHARRDQRPTEPSGGADRNAAGRQRSVGPLEPVDPNYAGEVARRYRFADGEGEIGMITSVTQPFCGGCTRARLSPEGKLVTCLFASDGHDLRAFLRDGATDEELQHRFASIWGARDDRYSELRTEETAPQRKLEMYHLGG